MEIKNKKSKVRWIAGSVAVTAAGFLVIPPILKKCGNKLYKAINKSQKVDFDNLGPEVVSKDTKEEIIENEEKKEDDN